MTATAQHLLDEISQFVDSERPICVVTVISDKGVATKTVIRKFTESSPNGVTSAAWNKVLQTAERVMASGQETSLERIPAEGSGNLTVSVEVIRPKARIVIFGAGHVGQALALLASQTGYEVQIADDRQEFLSRQRLPDPQISVISGPYDQTPGQARISSNTAVVIVTRGHQHDEVCLREVLKSPAKYIGMIGSRRRVIGVFHRLEAGGVSPAELERVHAPIGLDIGARSPQEIGVAILAEIIQTFNSHLRKNWTKSSRCSERAQGQGEEQRR